MLVLVIVILVFVREAALPFSAIFLVFLLENLDLNARQGDLCLSSSATDDLFDSDAFVDLGEKLNVLIHANMGAPAVSDSVERLLEHGEVHSGLSTRIVDPLL